MATDGPPAPRPLWRDLARSAAVAVTLALLLRGSVVESFSIPSGSMVPTLEPGDRVFVSKLAYGVRLPFTGVALVELPGPRRGDVIVFHDPRDPSQALVKRVVGVAGDRVELREQVLWLNGVPQPRADLGELSYEEPGEGGGPPRADTCRRFRESLALGRVEPPPDPAPEAADAGAAPAAGPAGGVARYDVLQCRRVRAGRREGPYGPIAAGHVFVLGDNRDRSDDGRADGGWQVPVGDVVGRVAVVGWTWRAGVGRGARIDRLFKPVE